MKGILLSTADDPGLADSNPASQLAIKRRLFGGAWQHYHLTCR
jgi:hypothetical protein